MPLKITALILKFPFPSSIFLNINYDIFLLFIKELSRLHEV